MEELRNLIGTLADAGEDEVVENIPKIMEKIKEVGFLKVVEDEDLKDFLPEMMFRPSTATTIPTRRSLSLRIRRL